MVEALEYWIGIDLGTTNSVVAIWTNGRAEIVQNAGGWNTTPSVVQFRPQDGGIHIGEPAV